MKSHYMGWSWDSWSERSKGVYSTPQGVMQKAVKMWGGAAACSWHVVRP